LCFKKLGAQKTEEKRKKEKTEIFPKKKKISLTFPIAFSLLSLSKDDSFKKKSERVAPEGKKKRTRGRRTTALLCDGRSRGAPGGTESLERGAREFDFFFIFFVFFFVSSKKK